MKPGPRKAGSALEGRNLPPNSSGNQEDQGQDPQELTPVNAEDGQGARDVTKNNETAGHWRFTDASFQDSIETAAWRSKKGQTAGMGQTPTEEAP